MNEALRKALKQLRLSGLLESLEIRLQEAAGHGLSHAEFLELIVQDELVVRDDRKLERRYKTAQFRERKSLEDFDWSFNPAIPRKQVYDLASCRFLREGRDVLWLGPPCELTKPVAADADRVLSNATPIEPPTCCIVFTIADATPASSGSTSPVAVAIADLARRSGFAVTVCAPPAEQSAFAEADRRIGRLFRSKVAFARLDTYLLPFDRDLQIMKAAIEFQVLWRKGKQIRVIGWRSQSPETVVKVVAVLDEGAAGGIRQVHHHFGSC